MGLEGAGLTELADIQLGCDISASSALAEWSGRYMTSTTE